jgi:hypothetical protein
MDKLMFNSDLEGLKNLQGLCMKNTTTFVLILRREIIGQESLVG